MSFIFLSCQKEKLQEIVHVMGEKKKEKKEYIQAEMSQIFMQA